MILLPRKNKKLKRLKKKKKRKMSWKAEIIIFPSIESVLYIVVNFGSDTVNMTTSGSWVNQNSINIFNSMYRILTGLKLNWRVFIVSGLFGLCTLPTQEWNHDFTYEVVIIATRNFEISRMSVSVSYNFQFH